MTTETQAPVNRMALATNSHRPASAIEAMAARLQVDPAKLFSSLAATVFQGASNEEMLGLVVVANQYRLNPFLKQIYAFPKKGGGIVPIVGIDGWCAIINSEEAFDGCEFLYEDDEAGPPVSCTCIMFVKERAHPIKVTEYYVECRRATDPWNTMPRRMLRHKAFMQAGRLAFGLGGIYDEDEGRDVANAVIATAGDDHQLVAAAPRKSRTEAMAEKLKLGSGTSATTARAPAQTQSSTVAAGHPAESTSNAETAALAAAGPPQEAAVETDPDAPPTWETLKEHGISCLIEDAGTVIFDSANRAMNDAGEWDEKFGAYTVQGTGEAVDLKARQMAAAGIPTALRELPPEPIEAVKAAPQPKATRPRAQR